jgi:hypothetical protein
LVTFVDFRGKVLKTWRSPFTLSATKPESEQVRQWHQEIELEVRRMLSQAKRRENSRGNLVGACLFVEALKAYAARNYASAKLLLNACSNLLDDPKITQALQRVENRTYPSSSSSCLPSL